VEWDNTIGGSGSDLLLSVLQTIDGGYFLGGESGSDASGDKTENSLGLRDYWVVKLDGSGAVEWDNTIGGSSNDELYSVTQTSDNGYLLGGRSDSPVSGDKTEASQGSFDYWVVKLEGDGIIMPPPSSSDIEWDNTIGGNDFDDLRSVIQTSDGGYLLGGRSVRMQAAIRRRIAWAILIIGLSNWTVAVRYNGKIRLAAVAMISIFRDPDERRRLFVGWPFESPCERR
jgi:hypothetical protein